MANHARTLTRSELQYALLVAANMRHGKRNQLVILLSHFAGLRCGEIASLKVCDVVDKKGRIKSQLRLGKDVTKGRHARTVFLPDRLIDAIRDYLPENIEPSFHPLIRSQKGFFHSFQISALFRKIYDRCGFYDASGHSGRRFYITELHHNNVPSKVIMELAGHRNLSTTQLYIDATDQAKISAVSVL